MKQKFLLSFGEYKSSYIEVVKDLGLSGVWTLVYRKTKIDLNYQNFQ